MVAVDPGSENIKAAQRHASIDPETSRIEYRCGIAGSLRGLMFLPFTEPFLVQMI